MSSSETLLLLPGEYTFDVMLPDHFAARPELGAQQEQIRWRLKAMLGAGHRYKMNAKLALTEIAMTSSGEGYAAGGAITGLALYDTQGEKVVAEAERVEDDVASAAAEPVVAPATPSDADGDGDGDGVADAQDACPATREDALGDAPADGCPVVRSVGLADSTAHATFVPASGACAVELGEFVVASNYVVGSESGKPPTAVHIDVADCNSLEQQYPQLSAVIVHVEARSFSAVPLELASAQLVKGKNAERSVAMLAPLTNDPDKLWVRTSDAGVLSLDVNPGPRFDLVFLFANAKAAKTLRIAGVDLPIEGEEPKLHVESRNELVLVDAALRSSERCATDATLHAQGDSYQVSGEIERRHGQNLIWCLGARHTWSGANRHVQGVLDWIASSDQSPLQFEVTAAGYRYRKGEGIVRLASGRTIRLAERVPKE
jgi:hypothetical protein